MAQVLIRNLDDEVIRRLKERARRKERSLEGEVRQILTEAASSDLSDFRDRAASFRRKLAGRRHADSTPLIRADRQR
jgi:plasmid stability protein